jgi:conjugal transfer pilus assembly protein TrbC
MTNRKRMIHLVVTMTCCLVSVVAWSDEGSVRTQNALTRAQQVQRTNTVDLNALKPNEDQKARSRDVIRQAGQATPSSGLPHVATPRPAQTQIDLQAMVKSLSGAVPDEVRHRPTGPLIFVSLSLPETSLDKLSQDAKVVNATLVMRGMVNGSLRKTAEALSAYSRQGVNMVIDPQAFQRYGVYVVPAFVIDLATSADSNCSAASACNGLQSPVIEGDVSLAHAMRGIASRSNGRIKSAASQYAKALGG